MIFTKDKITKEEINEMPVESFGGTINMVETEADADKALKTISEYDIVGIDTETRPSFKKGQTNKVSLLQISTEDTCWLFRLNKIGYPDSLVRFFEDSRILKIGLGKKPAKDIRHNLREENIKIAKTDKLECHATDRKTKDIRRHRCMGMPENI